MSKRFGGAAPFGGRNTNSDQIGSSALVEKSTQQLLQQACKSGTLKLANRELTNLPRAMFDLQDVDYQNKKWWEEQDLHTVDFSHNEIQEIPVEFSNIAENLKIINSSYNVLISFPSEFVIACQHTLTKLDLSHNRLASFFTLDVNNPQSFPIFNELVEVDLAHNQLETLDGLSTLCPALQSLDVSNNSLVSFESRGVHFGRYVGNMKQPFPSLRTLKLNNNKLATLPLSLSLETNTSLESLDLSCNGLTLAADDGRTPICFGPSLTTLNLKQNRIQVLFPEQIFCPKLKELTVGNNAIQRLPENLFARSPLISLLDLSNNKLMNIDAVLSLRGLSRLDIQNNDVGTLNPKLSLLPKLTNIVLDGNPLRSIRRDIINRGTLELLKYLRTRLSIEDNDEERQVGDQIHQLQLRKVDPSAVADSPEQRGSRLSAAQRTQLDRPYATNVNAGVHHQASDAAREAARQQEEERLTKQQNKLSVVPEGAKLIHAGERSGTTWDLSLKQQRQGGRSFAASRFDQNRGAQQTNPTLPSLLDSTLNFSTMHSQESAPFRNGVTVIRFNNQPEVEAIDLSFTAPFPVLKELVGTKCSKLHDLFIDPEKVKLIPGGQLAELHSLMFSGCGFSGELLPELLGDFNSPLAQSLTRLDFSSNLVTALPPRMPEVCTHLRYIDLSYNKLDRFPNVLFQLPQLIELNFAHNGLAELPVDDDGDIEGYAARCWPALLLLDLSYNELCTVPYTFGNLKLRSLGLEGNRIKWLRSTTLQKGTPAVLQYLKDKIPQ